MVTWTATLQEKESEIKQLREENTKLCVQPVVSELSRTVGALELDRDRLTMALTEADKTKEELSATIGELELDRHRLTVALTEQVGEVERLKKEKKELQGAMEAQQSRTQLSPEVAKLSETLSKWDSSLQELICKVGVSCATRIRHSYVY